MRWGDRKLRIALVLGFAVMIAFVAWRTNQPTDCVSGRHEVRDDSGRVVKIERKECR